MCQKDGIFRLYIVAFCEMVAVWCPKIARAECTIRSRHLTDVRVLYLGFSGDWSRVVRIDLHCPIPMPSGVLHVERLAVSSRATTLVGENDVKW